jgi:hypothetical protein
MATTKPRQGRTNSIWWVSDAVVGNGADRCSSTVLELEPRLAVASMPLVAVPEVTTVVVVVGMSVGLVRTEEERVGLRGVAVL